MSLTRRALTAGALAAGLLLAACAGPSGTGASPSGTTGSSAGTDHMTVGLTYVPDIQFAPFYVAEEKGYYKDAGVDVTLRHHGQSEGLFTAVGAGEEDVVVAGGDEMLQARSQGVPLKDVATLYQQYPVVLIVPEDSPIQSAADLRGKKIGIPGPFGETYFGLLAMLDAAGLTEADVDVQHIGFTQQAALTAGHVDAVMGFVNNDAVNFATAGTKVRTIEIPDGPGGLPLVGIGLGVLDATAADRPEDVRAVVQATLRGVKDVAADPEAAVKTSAAYVPDLTRPDRQKAALATLEATIPLYEAGGTPGAQNADTWAAMATFMADRKLLQGQVDPAQAWTDEFLTGATN
ncbi:ABC transporter substrate-binding protein [Georgenia thermotolerans]|uniref:PhnD/SsuA/transferrin family substrate-binding protein n=1 Tax=Georgenia thermotolerans TaxID=527326 RepID=A0A7J5UM06_9MICO|nr:ABC transporter substrate-binding protein [Georgenia thermotolerans]KAE8762953.1 PhnD/SsuA/transferrin family substrate-binding protein [Georgenia thermotolerans]